MNFRVEEADWLLIVLCVVVQLPRAQLFVQVFDFLYLIYLLLPSEVLVLVFDVRFLLIWLDLRHAPDGGDQGGSLALINVLFRD